MLWPVDYCGTILLSPRWRLRQLHHIAGPVEVAEAEMLQVRQSGSALLLGSG